MPIILCEHRINCEGVDSPVSNYSAEAPDLFDFRYFWWVYWNPNYPLPPDLRGHSDPPIYWAQGCESICLSLVSQADAAACAQRQAYLCGSGHEEDDGGTITLFSNAAQTCTAICQDGAPFTFVVPAGWIVTNNQSLSDQAARALACSLANNQMVCLSSISEGCVGAAYDQLIAVTRGLPPFTFTFVSGTIPPGLALSAVDDTSARLSGTPTTPGNYIFRIQARSASGPQIIKTYQLAILGITNFGSAPTVTKNAAYSFQLTATGGTAPHTFTIAAGALPAGLTLSSSGLISGTPTTVETAHFTLQIVDSSSSAVACQKTASLQVHDSVTCPTVLTQRNLGTNSAQFSPYCGATSTILHPNKVIIGVPTASQFFIFDADTQVQYTSINYPNPGFTTAAYGAYAPGTDKCFVNINDFFTGNQYLQIINTATDALGAAISDGPVGDLHGYYALKYNAPLDRVLMLGDNNGGTNAFTDALILNAHTNGFTRFICTVVPGIGNEVATDLDYCPANNRIYVTTQLSGVGGAIRGYDATTHALLSSVSTGGNNKPKSIVWNPDTNRFYVYTWDGVVTAQIIVYDPATDTIETTVNLGNLGSASTFMSYWPNKTLVAIPANARLYFFNPGDNTVLCSIAATIPFASMGVGGDNLFTSAGAFLTTYH